MKSKSSSFPFDDVTAQSSSTKSIPRKTEEFVNYIEYLATSPQLDHSKISQHLLQFLKLPKLKADHKSTILYALRNLNLPEDFWSSFLPSIKADLTENSKNIEETLYALCSCPPSCLLKEFHNFQFVNPYLTSKTTGIRFTAFYLLYNFRNFIKVDDEIVNQTLHQLKENSPRLIFLALNLLTFYINIDFPNIAETIALYTSDLIQVVYTHGHLLNIKHLSFILNHIHPSIQTLISFLPHVSISSACFLMSTLPACHDFARISDFPASAVLPNIIDIISHPYSDGMRTELLVTALRIIKISQNHHFFERIRDILFASNQVYELEVTSLFADVIPTQNDISQVLAKANESSNMKVFFNDLVAISSLIALRDSKDISTEVLKLLSKQDEMTHWKLAASCIATYMWYQRSFFVKQIQGIFEVCSAINDKGIRSLFLIFLAQFAPTHLNVPLLQSIKSIIIGKQSEEIKRSKFQITGESNDSLPSLLKFELVRSFVQIAPKDEIDSISSLLNQPIYKIIIERAIEQREKLQKETRRRASTPSSTLQNIDEEPPIPPFICCDVTEVGQIAYALAYPSSGSTLDFQGVHRDFVEVSPIYHALTIEIASVIVPKYRSLCLDLRLSAKGVVPSITIIFQVPATLTPPQVPEWTITDLNEGSKVTKRFSFTVNNLSNPFAMIRVEQEGVRVLEIKVCLPLIDFFRKVEPDRDIAKYIWNGLHHEKKGVKLPNSIWVSPQGVIAVRRGITRATEAEYLDMLASAQETRATIE